MFLILLSLLPYVGLGLFNSFLRGWILIPTPNSQPRDRRTKLLDVGGMGDLIGDLTPVNIALRVIVALKLPAYEKGMFLPYACLNSPILV
jgi:hypothetical protein